MDGAGGRSSSELPAPSEGQLAWLLPGDVDLEAGWRHEAAPPVWHGVVWGRLGRGDLAFAHFDRVEVPQLQPWVAAERGRIVRELGLHAQAEVLEVAGLAEVDDPVDEAMLRVSLTADAVGQGDVDGAVRRLEAARAAVAAAPDGPRAARQRLRLTWVEVEVAFLTGRRPPPKTLAKLPQQDAAGEPVFDVDHREGTAFHRAKSLLFAAIAADRPQLLERAAGLAPPALAWAVHLARADRGVPGAEAEARAAFSRIVPPPSHAVEVAGTPTVRRLRPDQTGWSGP